MTDSVDVVVRQFRSEDLPQVVDVFKDGMWSYAAHRSYPQQTVEYMNASVNGDLADIPGVYIAPGGNFWVATPRTEPNTVVGFVGFERKQNKEGEVRRMSVKESHRRHGLGRKLIAQVEDWARDQAFRAVWLTTGGEMDKARAFYDSVGYTQTGVIVVNEDPYFEGVRFEKVITQDLDAVVIRQFRNDDLEQVVTLFKDGMMHYPAHKMNADLLEQHMAEAITTGDLSSIEDYYIAPGGNFLVAATASNPSEVVGMVALEAKEGGVGELRRMSVKDSYRRHGVGRKLVAALEQWAKAHDYRKIWLGTGAVMDKARAFYTSVEYTKTKTFVINEDPRVEGVRFEKMLNVADIA